MYRFCKIKELPPKLRDLALERCIRGRAIDKEQYLEVDVNFFTWSTTKEGHEFWKGVYAGNIPEEYLTEQYEIY